MNARMTNPMEIVLRGVAAVFVSAIFLVGNVPAAGAQGSDVETRVIRVSAQPGGLPQRLSLALNKAAILELEQDTRDVIMANPAIADAIVRSPRRVVVLSLAVGQTNAIFLDAEGRHIATVEIAVNAETADLNDHLRRDIPRSSAYAEGVDDGIVLSGEVASLAEADRAQRAAVQTVLAPEQVVNNLAIQERQQVLIKVRVSEVSRTIAKQFGINVGGMVEVAGVPIIGQTGNEFSLLGRALNDLSGGQIGSVCASGVSPCPSPNNLQGVIQALERVGLVRTLAEPNLTAVSGEAARFLAGGEFPVPVGRDRDGNITIEFKPFGVGLAFTPIVLSSGRISLQLSTEVSELTNTGAFTLAGSRTTDEDGNVIVTQGVTLPALSVRRTETTVELPSGGSIAIGGLIQQQTKQSIDSFPGLKDLPVLGALFRSRDYQNDETELVVTVTAYLVDPVAETQLATPDQGFSAPSDLETILFGRLNAVYGEDDLQDPAAANVPPGTIGYIVQ
ncbi:MAG: hypothetical protein RJB62_414 [Pseudomonadota bacterium]|jgi:pilus assembly protein CpaC